MTSAPVRTADSIAELLIDATERTPFANDDSLSGSRLERVRIGGAPYVVKFVSAHDDWLMRACGNDGSRLVRLFASDLLAPLPSALDHTVVAVARDENGPAPTVALLMRDVGGVMLRTDEHASLSTHRLRLDHMAAMHAAFWGAEDDGTLLPLATHYTFLGPATAEREARRGGGHRLPEMIGEGWDRLHAHEPEVAALLVSLADDPSPLVTALRRTPQTLVHGDWKFGNLGQHPDGRTVLLDWDRTGVGPCALDLAWYLAVNNDLLPEAKETAIDAYRAALIAHGVAVDTWWETQLSLCLLGAFVQLGWSKTHNAAELAWWGARAHRAQLLLG